MKPKEGELYAVDKGTMWACLEFMDSIQHFHEASLPQCESLPHLKLYCTNDRCAVRQVEIRAKLDQGQPMRDGVQMDCPSCGNPMKFLAHMHSTTLSIRAAKAIVGDGAK